MEEERLDHNETIFSNWQGGLSRHFLSPYCCGWYSSDNICKVYSISLPTMLTGRDRLVCCHGHGQGQDCIVEHLKSVSVFCVVCMSVVKSQTFVGKITM